MRILLFILAVLVSTSVASADVYVPDPLSMWEPARWPYSVTCAVVDYSSGYSSFASFRLDGDYYRGVIPGFGEVELVRSVRAVDHPGVMSVDWRFSSIGKGFDIEGYLWFSPVSETWEYERRPDLMILFFSQGFFFALTVHLAIGTFIFACRELWQDVRRLVR